MRKNIFLIINLSIIFNSFQTQASSPDSNAAVGIGLFAASIACVKIAQHWNKPKDNEIKPLHDINQTIAKPRSIFNSFKKIQTKKLEISEEEVLSKYLKNQSLALRAVMTSLSSDPTKEEQWFHTIFNKEQYRKAKDQVSPQLHHIYNQKHEAYIHNNPSVAPKLLTYTEEWHQAVDAIKLRQTKLEELKPLAQLDDTTKLQKFLSNNVFNIETTQTERAKFFGEKQDKSHAHAIIISTERTFTPKNSSTNEIIYLPVIHGTFATKGKSFGDDETHPITESMILYAQRMALEKNAVVKLLVIKWNGQWDEQARIESGKNLANQLHKRINKENPNANISVQVIAHSYGCDVARIMIQESSQDIQFDRAFFLASPPTQIDISNKVQDFHLYGDLDAVATAEAWRISNRCSTSLHNPHAHVNIRAKIESEDLNHKSIKNMIRYLHEIPTIIESFSGENALIIDICKDQSTNALHENMNDSQDNEYFHDLPDDIQYNTITLIDTKNRNGNASLSQDLLDKNATALDAYQKAYPYAKDPFAKRTYQEAFNSEVISSGGQDTWIKNIFVGCVGFFETLFGRSSSPIASETTSESRTSPLSSENESEASTPSTQSENT